MRMLPMMTVLSVAVFSAGCAGRKAVPATARPASPGGQSSLQVDLRKCDSAAMASLDSVIADIHLRIESLEERMNEADGALPDTADAAEDTYDSAEELEQLTARVEAIEGRLAQSPGSPQKARGQPEGASGRAGSSTPKRVGSPSESQARGIRAFRPGRYDEKRAYEVALGDFRERRYEQAAAEFTEILSMVPSSDLADNAQYWIGECRYALGSYRTALGDFERVLGYSRSEKLDDALLKIGLCHLRLGNQEQALGAFTRLLSSYPDSEYRGRVEAMVSSVSGRK